MFFGRSEDLLARHESGVIVSGKLGARVDFPHLHIMHGFKAAILHLRFYRRQQHFLHLDSPTFGLSGTRLSFLSGLLS